MYADGIVTLSSSAKGIQARLSKLEKYWSDWCLNIQKTKEMIFNKVGRNITQKLMFQNNMIDCVSSYKYLGVHLTVSGSFHEARSELHKKALKTYHILRNIFLNLNPGIKTTIHVFESTVKPILLYNVYQNVFG